ncbi:MAG: acyltransferase [Planctomycetota bacterium]|jgi:acetyltransferase-like isoleucine patch superfamily enzyme|nr:acyltransferase [Planctomycetota bacterium]
MNCFGVYRKFRERWIRAHTWMVGGSLGACGGGCRIESPILLNRPDRVFVGRGAVICAGAMLSCIENEKREGGSVGEIHIGANCHIRENVQITAAGSVHIGEKVGIGRNCLVSDHDHGYEDVGKFIMDNPITAPRPVVIEDGCFLGCAVRVAPGVRIGRNSLVGFGAVVTRDIPPFSVAVGAPARVVRRYNFETGRWESRAAEPAAG